MKILNLIRKPLDLSKFRKRSALESDYETLITESCIIKENGEIKIVYQELDWDTRKLVGFLREIRYNIGTRTLGLKSTSKIFGYMPRNEIRRNYCRITTLARENPGAFREVCGMASRLAKLYLEINPELIARHYKLSEKVKDGWRLKDSPFTSGIINKNNPLKYHFDAGNFKNVYSAMLVFKKDIGGDIYLSPNMVSALNLKTILCSSLMDREFFTELRQSNV